MNAHDTEFARLAAAWLDQTATPEEAARLWQAIAEDSECALAFAAAARFDSLLAETVKQRRLQQDAARQVVAGAVLAASAERGPPATRWRQSRGLLRMAAGVAVLALTAWLLWPSADDAPRLASAGSGKRPPRSPQMAMVNEAAASQPSMRGTSLPRLDAPVMAEPLDARLNGFFLDAVAFDSVPLREAMGILQGRLQELNFLNDSALQNLRITLPTNAAGRRITFHSGPISFLKAVRAVAALGGCDASLDGRGLALTLHPEIYPQVPERRDLRSLLAGVAGAEDGDAERAAQRAAALLADAVALGIAVDPSLSLEEQAPAAISRGQWAALQELTAAREQLQHFAAPSFEVFLVEEESPEDSPSHVIERYNVPEMRQTLQSQGFEPVVVKPLVGARFVRPDFPPNIPVVTAQPLGQVMQVAVDWPAPPMLVANTPAMVPDVPSVGVTALLQAGQGASLQINAVEILGTASMASRLSATSNSLSATASGQSLNVILLPSGTSNP